jgi:Domain of unknown function (DUF4218)
MYPFERAMDQLKGLVRSRSRPEGSIVEGYVAEEIIDLYTDYLDDIQSIILPKSQHEGRIYGTGIIGYKVVGMRFEMRHKAHLKVLQHLVVVAPYVTEHLDYIQKQNPSRDENYVIR